MQGLLESVGLRRRTGTNIVREDETEAARPLLHSSNSTTARDPPSSLVKTSSVIVNDNGVETKVLALSHISKTEELRNLLEYVEQRAIIKSETFKILPNDIVYYTDYTTMVLDSKDKVEVGDVLMKKSSIPFFVAHKTVVKGKYSTFTVLQNKDGISYADYPIVKIVPKKNSPSVGEIVLRSEVILRRRVQDLKPGDYLSYSGSSCTGLTFGGLNEEGKLLTEQISSLIKNMKHCVVLEVNPMPCSRFLLQYQSPCHVHMISQNASLYDSEEYLAMIAEAP